MQEFNRAICKNENDLLDTLINRTTELIETNEDDPVEQAFLLGMFHLANGLLNARQGQTKAIKVCLDYSVVKKSFDYAKKQALDNQISFEELYPDLFKQLKSYINTEIKKQIKKQNKE